MAALDEYKDWLAGEVQRLRKIRDIQATNYHVNLRRAYRNKDLKSLPKPVLIPAIMADALIHAAAQLERIEQGARSGSKTGSDEPGRDERDGGE